jgi:trigger factor
VKSAVETVSPTRVKVTVEVPFSDLKPSLDAAYQTIAAQVNIPGFRRGKVPASLIDQRFGREVVLNEALNDAMPGLLQQVLTEHAIEAIGRPELELGEIADGADFTFVAAWSVKPEFELPDYRGLAVTIPAASVSDADVDEELDRLRARFGTLNTVERAVADGDFVVLDLVAEVDGTELAEGTAAGQSYQVGSGDLGLEGLDEALVGLAVGDTATVSVDVHHGDHAGETATVTATVTEVRERTLPEVDDEFAQLASEFDTVAELREELTAQLGRFRRLEQGVAARDAVLAALLDATELPLPEEFVAAEVADHLEGEGKDADDPHGEEVAEQLRSSLRQQFVLDAVAADAELAATEAELTQYLVQQAQRYGVAPDVFAQEVIRAGQVEAMLADVVRGKALALVLQHAVITDSDGAPVDLDALNSEFAEPVPSAEAIADELLDDAEDDDAE